VSAHAMNNAGPTAQIIDRGGWGTSLDFVGHRKAITVVVSKSYNALPIRLLTGEDVGRVWTLSVTARLSLSWSARAKQRALHITQLH
jgi:hypothetical protein